MKSILKSAAVAAFLFALAASGAQAQSFEQLTRDGQAAFRNGDFATALDTRLRQLSMKAPRPQDHCFVYWGLYTAYTLGTGEMAKGMQAVNDSIDCLNAISDDSRDMLEFREEALRYRAMGLRDWGRYDEALAAVDAMTKLRPDRAVAHESTRAIILEAKGDYEAAANAYSHAAENENGKFWLRYGVWMEVRQRKLDLALADFAILDRASPYVPGRSSNMRAWLLVEQGKYDAAVAELRNDERADSANAAAHSYLRGYVEAARGNFDAAAAAFRGGASANPNNPTVQVALYLAQARAGNVNAGALTSLAGQLNPAKWPDAQVFYVLGKIDRREFQTAAGFGNPRLEQTRQCRATLVAGEVALLKGDNDTARAELGRTIASCTLEPAAQERTWAQGELARLTARAPSASSTGPVAPPVASSAPVGPAADGGPCAAATAHWTSAESIGTRAAYQDHLDRFANCPFATLATARLAALEQRGAEPVKPSRLQSCAPGMSRDSDGDCVRDKAERKPQQQRRAASRATSDGGGQGGKPALDCSTPAGLFACANRALTTLPVAPQ